MTHAYQEMYLSNAQALLGDAFDYAVNACGISGNDFVKLFSVSSVSKRIENGEPAYLAGKSGIEAVEDILVETAGKAPTAKPQVTFSRSREYWIGWAIAYYQWFSGRKFGDIFKVLSFEDLQQMYAPLHEADISKFADIADAKVRAYFTDTNLKRIRTTYGCTQAELAKRSGVSLRSIQMYEQHNKDINKASAETVLSLAKVLSCTMEDLLEKGSSRWGYSLSIAAQSLSCPSSETTCTTACPELQCRHLEHRKRFPSFLSGSVFDHMDYYRRARNRRKWGFQRCHESNGIRAETIKNR